MDIKSTLVVLALLIGLISANDEDGMAMLGNLMSMMNGGNNGKEGCKIECPSGSKPEQDPEHVPSSNGCGSFGFKLDVGNMPGAEECCDVHDKCYDTCNSARDTCDDDFQECLNKVCDVLTPTNPKEKNKCQQMGHVMVTGAKSMGCPAYTSAQYESCLCDGKKIAKTKKKDDDKNKLEGETKKSKSTKTKSEKTKSEL